MIDEAIAALRSVIDPDRGKDIVRLQMVRSLEASKERVSMTLVVKDPSRPFASEVEGEVRKAIRGAFSEEVDVDIHMDNEMISLGDDLQVSGSGAEEPASQEGVLNFLAIASGKGGVGKSTVAANVAVALAKQGFAVGLMDADVYGPSIPKMFGVEDGRPQVNERRRVVPLERYGVKLLSMGFLVDPDKAVIWRGPMATSAIKQFLGECEWGELDYLILDLPPGTGDVQLTIVQTVALTGAIIVSTPQDVALADARKGVAMFQEVNVPVLGIVENMAYFSPPDLPDRKYYIFGEGGAHRLADELSVPFLGEVPIEQRLRETGDAGEPIVSAGPDSASAEAFAAIAASAAEETDRRNAVAPPTQKVEILHR